MIPRFFFQNGAIKDDILFIQDKDTIHQLKNVLRRKAGDKVVFLDGKGKFYNCNIVSFEDELQVIILESGEHSESKIKVNLFQALPKKRDKWEMVLDQGTQVGVSVFIPITTERTLGEWNDKHRIRSEKILRESAEQSERGIIPELKEIVGFNQLIGNPPEGVNIIGDTFSKAESIKKLIEDKLKDVETVNIFIGPEGGFSQNEIDQAVEAGFITFSLGRFVMRTELAGVMSASVVLVDRGC